MTEPTVQRLFIALWPDPMVRHHLVELQNDLPPNNGQRVKGDNLHMTLLFLGATTATQRECLEQRLDHIAAAPFTLVLTELGYWRKPQVVWVGGENPPTLLSLAGQMRDAATQCKFTIDRRPFQNHLTLYRKMKPKQPILPAMIAPIVWNVRDYALVESLTEVMGVHYRVLRTWPLQETRVT